ncbi:arabinosyltransferase XEG113-like isoform X5 [Mangifera indica]|uniref:arabinosyltransferase XEG113-like isoform X5 n=1 Tax=Mangifera indica TaxID=29780 RepID=UPI001CF95B00|nr:arabinosyltransferase XEG113-like isoform X5 [Mangifera indica]
MGDWKNWYQEAANSKPLFKTIYTTVIIGILVSAFYVFSAISSSKSPTTASSTSWLSSPSSGSYVDSSHLSITPNFSRTTMGAIPPPVSQTRSKSATPIWEVPKTKKMPPLKVFRLTKDLVQQRAEDNVIILTFGNYAFMDFILTWVKHLTDLGLSNLMVGAMDTKLVEALYWKGVPVFDMGSHMSTLDVGWGSPSFHKMVDAAYNVGIFHWRPTESSKKLAKEWKEMLLADETVWDQNGFNDLVRRQLGPSVIGDSGLAYAYDGNLKLGVLPASIFCSGHTYFVQAMYQQLRLQPYAVHTTFQYSGTEGKRHRLREGMVFYDPPEYYDSPGGFLSFKPSIPKSLLLDGEHNLESHFTLINYQMKQIRTALAIASLLNRTLVMPKLWCRLDRLWFGHPGVLVGSMTRQPFVCPLDHVFEINVMLQDMPLEDFGPSIGIREYTFFDNPSLPKQVKESWLEVHLCQDGLGDCHASNNTTRPGVLRFPRLISEETFQKVFSSFKDVKVIQFSSMQDAFVGFTDKTRDEKFRKRVKQYVGIWCCVENQTPGHIYYDMYWDEKPGWKPVPPQKSEDDHPPW